MNHRFHLSNSYFSNIFVLSLIVLTYIGFSDKAKEGTFVGQFTRKPATYNNFNCKQPDNSGKGEDCVTINYTKLGFWNDVSCEIKLPAICQMGS